MGEGNQPIIPRDNPLARKLAAIGQLNETYGTRAQGGAGAPIVEETAPSAGPGTVLPPPPVPVTPEEEAELQRKFDEQWGNHPAAEPPVAAMNQRVSAPRAVVTSMPEGLAAIDLVHRQVVATNGVLYPIDDKDHRELMVFAFRIMVRGIAEQVARVAVSLGIQEEVNGKPAAETQGEAVPEVPGDQASQ